MITRRQFWAGFFLISVIAVISAVFYGYQLLYTPNILMRTDQAKMLYIPPGADFKQVRDSLDQGNFLHYPLSFYFLSRLSGYQENVQPGAYKVEPKTTNLQLIRKLKGGHQTPVKVTFANARLPEQFAERITRNIHLGSEQMLRFVSSNDSLRDFGFDTTTAPALYMPNTYEVWWTVSARGLTEKFFQHYQRFWNQQRRQKAQALKMSPVEVATLASIVAEEAKKKEEMPRIAGVYLNRLEQPHRTDGLLQADPTLKFALRQFDLKRLYDKHKKIDSPYNTYKYPGLPPGPIMFPSAAPIEAVLNHEDHDYFFFCAKPGFKGLHNFAENHRQHINNRRRYQQFLNREGIE